MAFGSTGILDDFNRGNGQPGTNWSIAKNFAGGTDLFTIDTNQIKPTADCYTFGYYNPSTYGADCEVYITVVARTTIENDGPYIGIRMVNPGASTLDGYLLSVENSGIEWKICRIDNGTLTQLGLTVDSALSNGDKMGLEAVGGTLKGYRYTSSAWSEIISRDDANYSSAGYLGLYVGVDDPNQRYDNFGGGNPEGEGCVNVITVTQVVVAEC